MLRRVSTSLILSQQGTYARLAAAAATSALSQRSCATYTNTSSNNRNSYNNNNNNRVQRNFNNNNNNNNNRRQPRVRPPAFDIVHWNDADVSAGHLLRVMHRDGLIVLLYLRQQSKIRADANASAEADVDAEEGDDVEEAGETSPQQQQQQRQQQGRGGHAKLEVSVPLSPIYIARLLGVLEGRAERVEIQTRFNNATFAKKPGTSEKEKTFVLTCSSRRRASGQEEGEEGKDVADETFDWAVELDAAESLMLQRFLSQALQYHVGFGSRA